jgi:hypothetical protein
MSSSSLLERSEARKRVRREPPAGIFRIMRSLLTLGCHAFCKVPSFCTGRMASKYGAGQSEPP